MGTTGDVDSRMEQCRCNIQRSKEEDWRLFGADEDRRGANRRSGDGMEGRLNSQYQCCVETYEDDLLEGTFNSHAVDIGDKSFRL